MNCDGIKGSNKIQNWQFRCCYSKKETIFLFFQKKSTIGWYLLPWLAKWKCNRNFAFSTVRFEPFDRVLVLKFKTIIRYISSGTADVRVDGTLRSHVDGVADKVSQYRAQSYIVVSGWEHHLYHNYKQLSSTLSKFYSNCTYQALSLKQFYGIDLFGNIKYSQCKKNRKRKWPFVERRSWNCGTRS